MTRWAGRRVAILAKGGINALDAVEVIDLRDAEGQVPKELAGLQRRVLLLSCLNELGLSEVNEKKVQVPGLDVIWAGAFSYLPEALLPELDADDAASKNSSEILFDYSAAAEAWMTQHPEPHGLLRQAYDGHEVLEDASKPERDFLLNNVLFGVGQVLNATWVKGLERRLGASRTWVVVVLARPGGAGRHKISLGESGAPLAGFDPVLSELELRFDLHQARRCGPEALPNAGPRYAGPTRGLDYRARDAVGFGRLLRERLAQTRGALASQNPVGLEAALLDVLADAADRAAHFQDAVSTEAALGTSRLRRSLRRHARLLDYRVHEGCNARAWVHLRVSAEARDLPAGLELLSALPGDGRAETPGLVSSAQAAERRRLGALSFESLTPLRLASPKANRILPHTWGEARLSLERGATRLTLRSDLALAAGDVLLLEAERGQGIDRSQGAADPVLRHVVKVVEVEELPSDPLEPGVALRRVTWHEDDALPFDLELNAGADPATVVRGNMVLVDHGRSVEESLRIEAFGRSLRARLSQPELSWRQPVELSGPASRAIHQDPRLAEPVLQLQTRGGRESWQARGDLLDAPSSARSFCVEMEQGGQTWLRFGDDEHGRRPSEGQDFQARYRVGRGPAGHVGADAIRSVVNRRLPDGQQLAAVLSGARNPLPAAGGLAPEDPEQVRRLAPQAFRVQRRAVTDADWEALAAAQPELQKGRVTRSWTGLHALITLHVDPAGDAELDEELSAVLSRRFTPYLLAGEELRVRGPRRVPVRMVLRVCPERGAHARRVREALLRELGAGHTLDGRPGLMHPDSWSFGEPLAGSAVIARVSAVPGVRRLHLAEGTGLQRLDRGGVPSWNDLRAKPGEILCCAGDPDRPELGWVELQVEGA